MKKNSSTIVILEILMTVFSMLAIVMAFLLGNIASEFCLIFSISILHISCLCMLTRRGTHFAVASVNQDSINTQDYCTHPVLRKFQVKSVDKLKTESKKWNDIYKPRDSVETMEIVNACVERLKKDSHGKIMAIHISKSRASVNMWLDKRNAVYRFQLQASKYNVNTERILVIDLKSLKKDSKLSEDLLKAIKIQYEVFNVSLWLYISDCNEISSMGIPKNIKDSIIFRGNESAILSNSFESSNIYNKSKFLVNKEKVVDSVKEFEALKENSFDIERSVEILKKHRLDALHSECLPTDN